MDYRPSPDSHAPTMRVTDAEREHAVEELTAHVATGRLAIDEFDARAGRAYAAVTRSDLRDVLIDLPSPTPVSSESETPHSSTSRDWLTWAGVGILCLTIWAVTSIATGNFLYPWPIWVIGPWGAMLALQRVTGLPVGTHCRSRRAY